jgi:hypothetical protein
MSATTTTKFKPCKGCPTPAACKKAGVCLGKLKRAI